MTLSLKDIQKEFHSKSKGYSPKTPIDGVEQVALQPWYDERGFFMELCRKQVTDEKNEMQKALVKFWEEIDFNTAQWSIANVEIDNHIKGLHYHLKQKDVWFFPKGSKAKIVLLDIREKSPTKGQTQVVIMGGDKPSFLKIPEGVAHGYRPLTNPCTIIYCVTKPFDINDPDELRVPWDHPAIKDLWGTKNG